MIKPIKSSLVIALLVAGSLQIMAQKSFKFDRVNFIPKDMKEVVFPAQLTKIGPDDTYKFVGTQNTIDVYPAQMNLGKGNGINVKDGAAKYTIEVFYTKKPEFKRAFDFQNARYTGDTSAGVCLRTEVKVGVGCKIKGEDGNTLVYFSLLDSASVEKGFVGYDAAKNSISITDKPSSAKWGADETAGRFFNEHEGAIRGMAVKKAVEYAGYSCSLLVISIANYNMLMFPKNYNRPILLRQPWPKKQVSYMASGCKIWKMASLMPSFWHLVISSQALMLKESQLNTITLYILMPLCLLRWRRALTKRTNMV